MSFAQSQPWPSPRSLRSLSLRGSIASRCRPVWRAAFSIGLAGIIGMFAMALPVSAQKVLLATSEGDITLELDASKAPRTVANFLQYVKSGHYDGTVFHRVINDFMIQGGGFTPEMAQKPTLSPIPLESRNGLSNRAGTIAMARTSVPDSATAQFFINVKDNTFLDAPQSRDGQGYAVFGRVVAGMDIVNRIKAAPTTTRGPHQNVPATPILIRKATLEP